MRLLYIVIRHHNSHWAIITPLAIIDAITPLCCHAIAAFFDIYFILLSPLIILHDIIFAAIFIFFFHWWLCYILLYYEPLFRWYWYYWYIYADAAIALRRYYIAAITFIDDIFITLSSFSSPLRPAIIIIIVFDEDSHIDIFRDRDGYMLIQWRVTNSHLLILETLKSHWIVIITNRHIFLIIDIFIIYHENINISLHIYFHLSFSNNTSCLYLLLFSIIFLHIYIYISFHISYYFLFIFS